MFLRIAVIALIALWSPLRAATSDEVARFLAGLPMHGTSLERTAAHPAWVQHAMEFDDAWRRLDGKLGKLRTWAPQFLAPQYDSRGNVFYFFSGPDQLYAQQLFPNATNYVLVAREPVGALPDPQQIPRELLPGALENLRKTLNAVLSWSFFVTKDMKVDLNQQQLNGTLPVILVFLARGGCRIDSVEPIGISRSGALTAGNPANRGVKITCFGPWSTAEYLLFRGGPCR